MKKAILTCGLFSLMLVLTSFTSPEIGGQSAPRNGNGPTPVPFNINGQMLMRSSAFNDIGGQSAPRHPEKALAIGGQSAPRNGDRGMV